MNIKKSETTIWVLIAVLWIVIIALGTVGHFVIAMCLGVGLMFLHMILGCAKNGVVSKKFLLYPIGVWAVLWLVSFILSGYWGSMFNEVFPSFTILGLHPSFAPTVFLYWIGGQLTINLGLYLFQDEWLSESEWTDFCNKAKELK